jgi:hypothetical protein
MFAWSADAKTSAGAPCAICVSKVDDGPKLKVTVVAGFAFLKSAPILPKACVNDAAADTVTDPVTLGVVVVVVVSRFEEPELPHALATSPSATASGTNSFMDPRIAVPPPLPKRQNASIVSS